MFSKFTRTTLPSAFFPAATLRATKYSRGGGRSPMVSLNKFTFEMNVKVRRNPVVGRFESKNGTFREKN
jgi:hypothetical protein